MWYGGQVDAFGVEGEDTSLHAPRRLRVQDFHVCDYLGSKGEHLCWSERADHDIRKKVVLDNSYELVQELRTPFVYDGGVEGANMHEFNMVDDGENYLQPAWPVREFDLSEVGGPTEGYIVDG